MKRKGPRYGPHRRPQRAHGAPSNWNSARRVADAISGGDKPLPVALISAVTALPVAVLVIARLVL